MKREKIAASPLGDQLRTFAAAYAANGQRDKADGLVQASYSADAFLAGTTTGIVDPIVEALLLAARAVTGAAERVTSAADRITEAAADLASAAELVDRPSISGADVLPSVIEPRRASPPRPARDKSAFPEPAPPLGFDSGQWRVLVALRRSRAPGGGLSRRELAVVTEYNQRGGRFGNILGSLRSRGLIEGAGEIRLTVAGLDATSIVSPLPTGERLLAYWMRRLPKAAADILAELVSVYPRKLTADALASRLGRELKGGSFGNGLGRLRTLRLVDGKRELAAAGDLLDSDGKAFGSVNGAP